MIGDDFTHITDTVGRYYADKLREHGPTHLGVDWNSIESQRERFEQLTSVVDRDVPYSLLDWGCGYGGLLDHLIARGDEVDYRGYDVSPEMVASARGRQSRDGGCVFTDELDELEPADYVVASGIFQVKGSTPDDKWAAYVEHTIEQLARYARRGFAFNMLTSYSDAGKMRPDLHYADPLHHFDICKRRYSRQVALLHDYGIWEFTIRVRLDMD